AGARCWCWDCFSPCFPMCLSWALSARWCSGWLSSATSSALWRNYVSDELLLWGPCEQNIGARGTLLLRLCHSFFWIGVPKVFANREGQKVPQASFRTRTESGDWKTVTTDELF